MNKTPNEQAALSAMPMTTISDTEMGKRANSCDNVKVETASSPAQLAEWSTTTKYCTLVGAYVMILVVSVVATTALSLTPYVTSAFGAHSLIPLTNLVAYVVSAVIQLPLSRIIDLSGHLYSLVLMIVVYTLGLVLLATCRTVEWYATAFVMFEAAYGGLLYLLRLLVIDTVKKQNQAVAFGLTTFPYLFTPFTGPPMAQAFLEGSGWRWAYGTFSIVMPIFGLAMAIVIVFGERSVKKQQQRNTANRPLTWKRIADYLIDFDVIGLLLCCVGIGLLLVSISVAIAGPISWISASFISMLVMSIVILVALVLYEHFVAPKPFVTLSIMSDRSAWGATLAIAGQHMSYGIWFPYLISYSQVVFYENIRDAGYISSIYLVGSGTFGAVAGLLLRYTHRFKLVTAAAIAGTILSTGLIIYCSKPESSVGGIIGCLVVLSISTGFLNVSTMMGVLHEAKPGENALRMALFFMVSLLFSALGSTVSTAIWRNTLPTALLRHLPENLKSNAPKIAGSIVVQLSYPRGSVARDAVNLAFAKAWRALMIAGTAVLALSAVGVAVMKEGQPSRKLLTSQPTKV